MGGLGMPEIIIIMVIALIVFGPRKLPELGKSLGKAMNQFRRASEDFKRTWEQEVDLEHTRKTISSTSESSTASSTEYSTEHNSDYSSSEYSYDPYNSDYGYNAPSDDNVAAAAGHDSADAMPAETPATPVPAATKNSQAGQWI